MNIKRYLLSVLVVFLTFEILNFFIHSILLSELYTKHGSLWRVDMISFMWLMYIASFMFTLFFVFIYIKWFAFRFSCGNNDEYYRNDQPVCSLSFTKNYHCALDYLRTHSVFNLRPFIGTGL